ncbi:MAG: hypothetical protein IJL43_00455 [Lachnospiraceae bacterium]|nr:hypothetical protein [Lachnospiraceae bacterium]
MELIVEANDTEEMADGKFAFIRELVRCKDCKHRDADDFCTGRGYPNLLVADDGFCDKGERRK